MDAETTSQKATEKSDVDSTILSSRSLYQHDPLLVLLKDKLHRGTLWIVAGGFSLGVLVLLFFYPIFQSGFRPTIPLDALFVGLLVVIASILNLLIYLLLPTSIASVFNSLRANGVIGSSRQEQLGAMSYARFLQHMIAWMDSRWWSIAIVLLSILNCLYIIFIAFPQQTLTLPPLYVLVSYAIGYLPTSYMFTFVFLRLILLMIFLNRLFLLFNIRVRPLHPDGSGGLATLSQTWWMSAALLLVTALVVTISPGPRLSVPTSPVLIIIGTLIYLALIIALAIGWLALPHHVMVQARNEHLQPLFEEYERVLMETRPAADEATVQIVAGTERLSALKLRYDLVRDTFPTWPLQIMEIRRLSVALLLPALIALLPALFQLFTKK
jgi:hypothetical protein